MVVRQVVLGAAYVAVGRAMKLVQKPSDVRYSIEHINWMDGCMNANTSDPFDSEMSAVGPCEPEAFAFDQRGEADSNPNCRHPESDRDPVGGHGNQTCRFEPTEAENSRYRASPEDIAIVLPYNKDIDVAEDISALSLSITQYSVHQWRKYARHHGYAFYFGTPKEDPRCYGMIHRAVQWVKPCMAMQLLDKHSYVLVVDTDTFVAKPRLRLEPLFAKAGLLDASAGKTIAIAQEWGSCSSPGLRHPMSGEYNSGIYLLKSSDSAKRAMKNLWDQPWTCVPSDKSLLRCRKLRPAGDLYDHIGNHWLRKDPNAEPCKKLIASMRDWSMEQAAFDLAIVSDPAFKPHVTTWASGCPINGPYGDFISHMISGTIDTEVFHNFDRVKFIPKYTECINKLLDSDGDHLARCSICDALTPQTRGFTKACPNRL